MFSIAAKSNLGSFSSGYVCVNIWSANKIFLLDISLSSWNFSIVCKIWSSLICSTTIIFCNKYITITNSKHNNKTYSNLIKDKELIDINQVWCANITYIRILNGFVYLAAIIDIYSRKIIGYAIDRTPSSELAIIALKMTIATRRTDNLIYHSDQGIQYTCKD